MGPEVVVRDVTTFDVDANVNAPKAILAPGGGDWRQAQVASKRGGLFDRPRIPRSECAAGGRWGVIETALSQQELAAPALAEAAKEEKEERRKDEVGKWCDLVWYAAGCAAGVTGTASISWRSTKPPPWSRATIRVSYNAGHMPAGNPMALEGPDRGPLCPSEPDGETRSSSSMTSPRTSA